MTGNRSTYIIWLAVLCFLCLIGLFTAYRLFTEGHWLFNTNDVIIWSLPLGMYIFLALCSSGLTLLASVSIVFGVRRYDPFAKRLVFLSIATLSGGFVSIGLELGNIWHMIYIMISPNPSSPIWWMGTIYSVELVVLSIKLWRMHMNDWESRLSKAAGVVSFFCAIVAPLMIGSVFGITESRVTYFGPVLPIYCFLMALLSGSALFMLYCTIGRNFLGMDRFEEAPVLYDEIMKMLKYTAATMVVFTILKTAIEGATVVPEYLAIRKF